MIGVFDSGLGGLTVVKELFRIMPDAPLLYLGDVARMPYGTKSKETICRYTAENTKFLLDHGATEIIIACNTASSLAYEYLTHEFPHISFFEVISPAAHAACAYTKNNTIGVLGTRATIGSRAYEQKILDINASAKVFSVAAPLLVPLIEEGWATSQITKMVLRKYIYPLRLAHIDALILGCTHFPLIKDEIWHRIGTRVKIIDSAEEVVKQVSGTRFEAARIGGESKFFVTDLTPHWQTIAEQWLGRPIPLEIADAF